MTSDPQDKYVYLDMCAHTYMFQKDRISRKKLKLKSQINIEGFGGKALFVNPMTKRTFTKNINRS